MPVFEHKDGLQRAITQSNSDISNTDIDTMTSGVVEAPS
jgi:hypothetical protein